MHLPIPGASRLLVDECGAKVDNLDAAVAATQEVCRLEVAMHHMVGVQILQTLKLNTSCQQSTCASCFCHVSGNNAPSGTYATQVGLAAVPQMLNTYATSQACHVRVADCHPQKCC